MLGAGPLRVCNLYTLITQNIIISGMFYIGPVSVRCELLIKPKVCGALNKFKIMKDRNSNKSFQNWV